jgi:hypothetical protein
VTAVHHGISRRADGKLLYVYIPAVEAAAAAQQQQQQQQQ